MTPVNLTTAQELKQKADQTGDAELYRMAAAEYRQMGFTASASICEQHAKHYQPAQENTHAN